MFRRCVRVCGFTTIVFRHRYKSFKFKRYSILFYSLSVHYKYNRFLCGSTIKTNKTDYRPINQSLIHVHGIRKKSQIKRKKNKLNKFHALEKFAPFLKCMHILPSTHMSWAMFEFASKLKPIKRYGKIRIFFFFFWFFSFENELKRVWDRQIRKIVNILTNFRLKILTGF